MKPGGLFDYPDSELVLAFVAATGTNTDTIQTEVEHYLKILEYDCTPLRLSKQLSAVKDRLGLKTELSEKSEYERIRSHQLAGTEARERSERGDILALTALQQIHSSRPGAPERPIARPRTGHLVRSLKHPDEVTLLRRVYGAGFFLIGIYAPEGERIRYLRDDRQMTEAQATELVRRDHDEGVPFGQQTRDTFRLADVFIRAGRPDTTADLQRYLDLIFGRPTITPTRHEHCMYLAYAASLRSASLARQVGASVATRRGDVISTGTNDVPRFRGGLYWPEADDRRDHVRGFDANDRRREETIVQLMERLRPEECKGKDRGTILKKGKELLTGTFVEEVTEYGREVHAEMEALLCCARVGASPRDCVLYTTTFPCHNCAKHIVAAGIRRVYYVEPYPKSKALELFEDSIALEGEDATSGRVVFAPFVGVGPRRYLDLFSMSIGSGYPIERKRDGRVAAWGRGPEARLRVPLAPTSYMERETIALELVESTTKEPRNPEPQGENKA